MTKEEFDKKFLKYKKGMGRVYIYRWANYPFSENKKIYSGRDWSEINKFLIDMEKDFENSRRV